VVDVKDVLRVLASERPVFHSEADFQHAFAWEIHQRLPNALIRLELPIPVKGERIHLDVWCAHTDMAFAVELKYKTRRTAVRLGQEQFALKDQSAQDLGRYDFIRDVQRLEQVVEGRENTTGYAVLLTNDSAYWGQPRQQSIYAHFSLHHGRLIQGSLQWGAGASAGTKRGREKPLILHGRYAVNWTDYSRPTPNPYGLFRYLMIEVPKRHGAR